MTVPYNRVRPDAETDTQCFMTISSPPSRAAAPIVDHPVRVIFVEDDEDLRQSVADYLRLQAIDVTDVASGIAFYTALMGGEFDIAILDVNLPDVSGFELARTVTARKRMGIVMLTARTSREDRLHGYEQGADLYLTKPVDSQELALAIANLGRRIRSTLAEASPDRASMQPVPVEAPIVQEAWMLDLRRHRLISPQGISILLSGREAMLLELLARATGATVPRQALDALLTNARSDPESRRLDAALHRLRMKARTAGADLPLHAVHAFGVRFIGELGLL
jgi:two-component system torCAD operon response regulator TorR